MNAQSPTPGRGVAPAALPLPRRMLPPASRDFDVDGMRAQAEQQIRERPLTAALIAVVFGFLLGKLLR